MSLKQAEEYCIAIIAAKLAIQGSVRIEYREEI
jgi:hypothetical protein